jgi:hypothetical protein
MPVGSGRWANLTGTPSLIDATMGSRGPVEKASSADFLRAMIGLAAQRLTELGMGEPTGAAHGGKSGESLERIAGACGEAGGRGSRFW